ncbi:MAG: hypothetical protein CL678_02510 [Bdellovibrionaceae bacterium]|nr:hypothetical protein [Pseudobdellovibrionaceae bacterium]|tara:strand:+ start:501 stop:869 length:369 start_codon:yes stop_codon:yes gene_type:complete
MKSVAIGFLLTFSIFANACECMPTDRGIFLDIREKYNALEDSIQISNIREKWMFIPLFQMLGASVAEKKGNFILACELDCTQSGLRVEADVQFQRSDEFCTGKYIKKAIHKNKFKIKNLVCE